MEDQQPDSGDLTESAALVPQGKSARRRHRLPRRELTLPAVDGDDETVAVEPTPDPESQPEPEPELAPEPEAEVEPETEQEPELEPEPDTAPEPVPRSRFGWRRKKVAQATESAVELDPEVESDTSDEPPPVIESTVEGSAEAQEPTESGKSEEADEAEEPEPVLVPHRIASRPFKVAAVVAGALVVAASAFAGANLQPYLSDRAAVQIKVDVARTATEAITTLWTYTPEDIDQLGNRASKYLGGDLATQYRQFIDGIVEANKQAQVTNQTQVVGAAVESLTPTEATALVFTNTTATSPVSKNIPSLRYVSYRLTLEKRDHRWLVTRMPNITSLDLTPRL